LSGFVLDSSVALSWCFGDERTAALEALESRLLNETAVVPGHWLYEVPNVLVLAKRRGRVTAAKRAQLLADFLDQPIEVEPPESSRVFGAVAELAAAHQLTVYDAAYLELAMRRGLPLATLDRELRRAAESSDVPLLGI